MMRLLVFLLFCMLNMVMSTCYASHKLDKNIIIFVSFSMPNESLKSWMRQAAIIDAPIVIRGFVNNSFKETVHKISELTKDNHGGVQIDPTLFQRFQVKQVPAVVVVKEPNCVPNMSCPLYFDIVYGNTTLDYALKKISNQEDSVSPFADRALDLLREAKHA